MNKEKIAKIINYSLIGILFLITILFFYYTDYSDTLDNSILLGKAIFHGKFFDYYKYATEYASWYTVYTANYNIFLYLIFLIWNLPIFILNGITGLDYMTSTYALIWAKILMIIFTFATLFILDKILKEFIKDKKILNLSRLLFLTNSCVVVPVMIIWQYDVISLFFILLGIYGFIKEKDKLFYLSFMIATPLKSFALFIYIPLLLIKEKRIPFILLKLLLAFSIQIIFGLPFMGDEWYQLCLSAQNRDAIELILNSSIQIGNYYINLFIISFIAICVYAYKYDWQKEDNNKLNTLYISALALASFILFVHIRSYWIVLIVPFIIIISLINKKNLRVNMLLLIIGSTCYTVYSFMNHWIYSCENLLNRLALHRFVEIPSLETAKWGNIAALFEDYDLLKYQNLLYSVFFIAIIILFIINIPSKKNLKEKEYKYEWWFTYLQMAITFALIGLLFYANLSTNGNYIYQIPELTEEDVSYLEVSPFEEMTDHVITQEFKVTENDYISDIYFSAYNIDNYRDKRTGVKISILDGKKAIVEEIVRTVDISTDKVNHISFDEVKIDKNKTYKIKIEPVWGRPWEGATIYFQKTNKTYFEDYPIYVDGKPQKGNLVMTIK